jgi:diguanylate cyclase
MLHKVEENTDWKSKYQDVLNDLEARELEWTEIEDLLRKTIGRLTIAGRGVDDRLDKQLRVIQQCSREKLDDKLALALTRLSEVIASLEDTQIGGVKQRRSDPIMLMLELLQNIHFNATQRGQLKQICSELLVSVANGHDRDSVSVYIQKLSVLINENFDNLDSDSKSSRIVLQLLSLLDLGEPRGEQILEQFRDTQEFREQELEQLAQLINAQINPSADASSIDQVMTTLLERLSIVQGANSATQKIQSRVHEEVDDDHWPETLNEVVNSISDSLSRLNHEKRALEGFIVNVTDQLGEVTTAIAEGHQDHQSDHEDTLSLQDFVQEGIGLIHKNVQSTTDLQELKSEISKNVDEIRDGVDDYAERFNVRHEATQERNLKLTEQLTQMEQETQTLHVMLEENRAKLLYDALTGVYSRIAYDERVAQELARWTRYQTPFSYVILDIDHFKRVNDSYGHNAGDKALKIVAQMMVKYVRQSDYVFRIGGEEFVLLLTSTSAQNAAIMVEKMRAGIAATSFHFKGEPVNLTLSAGITETRTGDDVESIYERADKGLYKAKNSGRNCQFIAD